MTIDQGSLQKYSLLPNNASVLERGLELAFYQLLYEIDNPYPQLLNPMGTQANMLPYIAQDRGVTEWDIAAPLSEQRQSASNAWLIRRYAGTQKGLELALDSLEYDCEITPWYANQDEPYHFTLTAWRRDNAPINKQVVQRMRDQIDHAKSERDSYELALAVGCNTPFSLAVACSSVVVVNDFSVASLGFSSPEMLSTLNSASAIHQIVVTTFTQ